jgi:hypothetical protein
MQVPLEIAFHNIKSAKWAEELIRARVAELEEIYAADILARDPLPISHKGREKIRSVQRLLSAPRR